VSVTRETVTSLDAPVSAAPLAGPAPAVSTVTEAETTIETTTQLDKGDKGEFSSSAVLPVAPALTPRGMDIPLYPAPAVTVKSTHERGIRAPYGQGLAAAAPVGTPYLRSPAFAGPPVIYMPQTVTRVLLPGQAAAP